MLKMTSICNGKNRFNDLRLCVKTCATANRLTEYRQTSRNSLKLGWMIAIATIHSNIKRQQLDWATITLDREKSTFLLLVCPFTNKTGQLKMKGWWTCQPHRVTFVW